MKKSNRYLPRESACEAEKSLVWWNLVRHTDFHTDFMIKILGLHWYKLNYFTKLSFAVSVIPLHSVLVMWHIFLHEKECSGKPLDSKPSSSQDILSWAGLHSSQTWRGVDFYSLIPGTVHHLVGDVQVEVQAAHKLRVVLHGVEQWRIPGEIPEPDCEIIGTGRQHGLVKRRELYSSDSIGMAQHLSQRLADVT